MIRTKVVCVIVVTIVVEFVGLLTTGQNAVAQNMLFASANASVSSRLELKVNGGLARFVVFSPYFR